MYTRLLTVAHAGLLWRAHVWAVPEAGLVRTVGALLLLVLLLLLVVVIVRLLLQLLIRPACRRHPTPPVRHPTLALSMGMPTRVR